MCRGRAAAFRRQGVAARGTSERATRDGDDGLHIAFVLLLILFAVVVGAGTAVSPCVLPVLPAMLSASGAGGRRRPLGIVLGLTTTFAITIIGIAKVVDGVGLGSDPLRDLAIVVLALFGVALIVPQLGQSPSGRSRRFRGSDRARVATASLWASGRRRRSASSTRRARDRSSPP